MLGESEKKVRDLFNDAHRDQKKCRTNSKLYAVIFDEIDAVCKSRIHNDLVRGAVFDNVTAQLLAEVHGMLSLDNILLTLSGPSFFSWKSLLFVILLNLTQNLYIKYLRYS